jgi:hypothetical protein
MSNNEPYSLRLMYERTRRWVKVGSFKTGGAALYFALHAPAGNGHMCRDYIWAIFRGPYKLLDCIDWRRWEGRSRPATHDQPCCTAPQLLSGGTCCL